MKIKRRIIFILLCFMSIILLLIGRLVQIQLIATESFTDRHINLIEKSVTQRTQAVTVDDGRGRFIDRNGEDLGEERYPVLVVFPFVQINNDMLEKIAHIIGVSRKDIQVQMKSRSKPFVFQKDNRSFPLTKEQMEKVNRTGMLGMVATEVRMQRSREAEHLIGVVGENEKEFKTRYEKLKKLSSKTPIGISGLQQSFDEFLITDGETKVLYQIDRQGEPIFGERAQYIAPGNPFYPVTVQTTIDKWLQLKAEELMKKHGLQKGGLVLLDVQASEIVAMVSKPSLQMNNQHTYKQRLENQMLTPHFPGSVFKTVIATAVIDNGMIQSHRMFNCDTDLYGEYAPQVMMGKLSFTDSFSRSCNRTFALLGDELMRKDQHIMETYLGALGASETVGWEGQLFHTPRFKQLLEEKKAIVWNEEETKRSHKAIAQTAIGQKDVKISPLAIANMMATIARGGEKKEVKAVRDITYKNGTNLFHFEDHMLGGKTLSSSTIKRVQQLLRSVVTAPNGTGSAYQSLPFTVAGKSGTAQTGKENRENRWFAGYFPYENPRYALVVVDLETNRQENAVTHIFVDYVDAIYKWEQQRK
ncbi:MULTISPECIES: penicillin-binding protein 2 [unclassified Bacillus (in: firmicutes)]|uniref:peptidoglycan D,D-transpeptidase FtsI family protein n=1 Tax=unclassified Bacillus (in: firmicutes) TaxID=185979 RepID=UPI0008E0BA27|nr:MULTISPECIES: penicillin-binding transpeptidase domain-containing protein [unclassified Bacillus (in: firmicutes)]SFJ37128.1 Cell division protein FtsI/penicillin-binding protein 2 [Bacillus sp. 71mf]SFS51677.1 Cell division protein FtsI/penicillin-binding protein 2 [Bacillus sp. 103mf]